MSDSRLVEPSEQEQKLIDYIAHPYGINKGGNDSLLFAKIVECTRAPDADGVLRTAQEWKLLHNKEAKLANQLDAIKEEWKYKFESAEAALKAEQQKNASLERICVELQGSDLNEKAAKMEHVLQAADRYADFMTDSTVGWQHREAYLSLRSEIVASRTNPVSEKEQMK